ncbi:MAG: alpha-ketoacid dehydrogenase subunit beta [Firmicutes bacterium]|nr:alpha-ketoacid dehydrogenase subunit beta [Bacillota bacterium]
MAQMTYLEAIRDALLVAMRQDDRVFLIGEDIGVYGGAFGITRGFLDEFGPLRVIDGPLAETANVGAGVGAAVMGMRPVVEMQFADFVTDAMTQVVNMAATFHYRTGWPLPLVIRMPYGGDVKGGPFHSQCKEAWFVHTPGLKVVAPAFAADAKGLLLAAIRDPNPVLYFEHKHLYRYQKEEVPEGDYTVPLGAARVVREGATLSVFSYGWMLHKCLQAADRVAAEGIFPEVVDLRSLTPLDTEAILASVRRTGKALIAYEANRTGGVGAEVAARIAEAAFEDLDGPIVRVASADTPVPHSPVLEAAFQPQVDDLAAAMRRLAAY